MPARRTRRLSYANVMSSLALFIALGGVSWAAATLPANSVGKRQLKDNAVTGEKVANGSLRAADFARGALPAGPQGPAGPAGAAGAAGGPVRRTATRASRATRATRATRAIAGSRARQACPRATRCSARAATSSTTAG